jgi:hypothetical protein
MVRRGAMTILESRSNDLVPLARAALEAAIAINVAVAKVPANRNT